MPRYLQEIVAEAKRRGITADPHASERARYAADPALWLAECGRTYDPRLPGSKLVPFVPFPRQVEFLRWLGEREAAGEDGLAEKSRDMGLTWLCVAYAVHGWLFVPGYSVGFGSRKLDLVDKIGQPEIGRASCRERV